MPPVMVAGKHCFNIAPLAGPYGARITGLDFTRNAGRALFETIEEALLEHQVLVFRDLGLDERQQVMLSEYFGSVQEHVLDQYHGTDPGIFMVSNLDQRGRPSGEHPDPGAMVWHTDGSWSARPGHISMLYALQIPSEGGDTLFADTYTAYEELDSPTRTRISTLTAVHDLNDSRCRSGARVQMTAEQRAAAPPVEHPIVRVHPETGRPALYLGEHAAYATGMPEAEGRALVSDLNERATAPHLIYRHRWRRRDLVMWDNRCVMHRATPYDTVHESRVIRRTTVLEPLDVEMEESMEPALLAVNP